MEKLCFIEQNNSFEWKNLVLLSKTKLFRETQETFKKPKKPKKPIIEALTGWWRKAASKVCQLLVFFVFLVF